MLKNIYRRGFLAQLLAVCAWPFAPARGVASQYFDNASLDVVPEPATWAMLLAGFGFTGAALRRRRTLAAV